jgi:hypothetical protein
MAEAVWGGGGSGYLAEMAKGMSQMWVQEIMAKNLKLTILTEFGKLHIYARSKMPSSGMWHHVALVRRDMTTVKTSNHRMHTLTNHNSQCENQGMNNWSHSVKFYWQDWWAVGGEERISCRLAEYGESTRKATRWGTNCDREMQIQSVCTHLTCADWRLGISVHIV